MNDETIQLLKNNELRQEVITTMQSVWRYAGTLYDNPTEDMEEYVKQHHGASLWEEAWWRAEIHGKVEKIEQAFEKYVIQKMSTPHRLSLEELVESFSTLTRPVEQCYDFEQFNTEDCNNLYAIFINYVSNHILSYRHSIPSPVCAVTYSQYDKKFEQGFNFGYKLAIKAFGPKDFQEKPLDVKDSESEESLWQRNGVSISLLRGADLIDERPAGEKSYHILAVIAGNISNSVCSKLQAEVIGIVSAAIRSIDLLQTKSFAEYKVIVPEIPLVYEREISGLPWGDEKLIVNAKPLIKQYLDTYYSEPAKKDSINRRIRNAVCLLIESDNQSNNAVGLALSMTALEALLGEKGEGLASRLADSVAVLLEPDTKQRYNATEFVKDLYNCRSRALHGELVETEKRARVNTRHLAAAVLSGMISRREFLRRLGYEPENPQDLLDELRKLRFDSGQPAGIEEYNIRSLWKK